MTKLTCILWLLFFKKECLPTFRGKELPENCRSKLFWPLHYCTASSSKKKKSLMQFRVILLCMCAQSLEWIEWKYRGKPVLCGCSGNSLMKNTEHLHMPFFFFQLCVLLETEQPQLSFALWYCKCHWLTAHNPNKTASLQGGDFHSVLYYAWNESKGSWKALQ